jgi:dephospho-CoA kinase
VEAPVKLAVTGGIGCGKSVVGRWLAAQGVPVCEADDVAHELLRRGEPVAAAVRCEFGEAIVGADGEIDRRRLGAIVFADPGRLARLNELVHPEVLARLHQWAASAEARAPAVAAVIPLLFEVGDERAWDRTVCVAAPQADQLARLEARGLRPAEARQRLAAQMALNEKMERADRVVFNGGSVTLLEEQMRRVLQGTRPA